MHALHLEHLWSHNTPDNDPPPPSPQTAPDEMLTAPPLPPRGRHGIMREHMLWALEVAQKPEATPADHVVTRYETLRHWVPLFREWVKKPARATRFFQQTPWPALDPVGCGVLVGLTFRARSVALERTAKTQGGAKARAKLSAAVHAGLLAVPALQPYGDFLRYIQEREATKPLPKDPVNFALRTSQALVARLGPQPQELTVMRVLASDVALCPVRDVPFKAVKAITEPSRWEPTMNQPANHEHLEELRGCIVSFIQYHNREEVGQQMLAYVRQLVVDAVAKPELVADMHLVGEPMGLETNFLAGALVGTLYLGLFQGLRDVQHVHGRRNVDPPLTAQCKWVTRQLVHAFSELSTAIDATAWGHMLHILENGIDMGVDARELRARIAAYAEIMQVALERIHGRSMEQESLMQQWRGLTWRMIQYPVDTL